MSALRHHKLAMAIAMKTHYEIMPWTIATTGTRSPYRIKAIFTSKALLTAQDGSRITVSLF